MRAITEAAIGAARTERSLHGVLGRREVGPAPDEDTDHRGYEVPQQRLVHWVTVGESARNGRTSSHS